MKRITLVIAVLLFGCMLIPVSLTAADTYPSKPITGIIPQAPGGSTDLLCRAVEKTWPKYSPQPLVVINKPGGGGVIGTEQVVRSKPDGYTMYLGYGSGNDIVMPWLQKMPFDPLKDLIPVARLSVHSVVIVTGANAPYKSVKDLIAWSKKEGKPLTTAVAAKAGAVDIALTAFGKAAGVNITTIPFSGGAEAVAALAGGHLMLGGGHPSEVIPHIKAGRFKALAVVTPQRDPELPNVPTLIEEGIKVHTWGSVKGVAVPAGTPREVVKYIEDTMKKVCSDADFINTMKNINQPIMYQNSADFAKFIKQAADDYAKLIKELNIKID
ncbi:MAG TPA: tripartite tricarboxylate transporter substrate binding protein [Syntrophorhabdaceae bacterium]|nr:tripartite tricarboxylate transporter substrate binding protein [Syntrophorhabdaceae bacterium]